MALWAQPAFAALGDPNSVTPSTNLTDGQQVSVYASSGGFWDVHHNADYGTAYECPSTTFGSSCVSLGTLAVLDNGPDEYEFGGNVNVKRKLGTATCTNKCAVLVKGTFTTVPGNGTDVLDMGNPVGITFKAPK
jgi:hypothetical protein